MYIVKQGSNQHDAEVIESKFKDWPSSGRLPPSKWPTFTAALINSGRMDHPAVDSDR